MSWGIAWIIGIIVTTIISCQKGQWFAGFLLGCLTGPFGIFFALISDNKNPERMAPKSNDNTLGVEPMVPPPTSKSGTGFIVNEYGYVLTNNHVIDGCHKITVVYKNSRCESNVIAQDKENDIAILRFTHTIESIALFRKNSKIRTAEPIIVIGFPLGGALSSEHTVTTGVISAPIGMGDDSRSMQITAPIHGGNSGGPLLDQSGNVIGIVNAKANDLLFAKNTGEIPQNVNFAIKSDLVESFLDAHNVKYETTISDELFSVPDIVDEAKNYVVKIECESAGSLHSTNNNLSNTKQKRATVYNKLINGDYGLAKTFWLYGFAVRLIANIILDSIPLLNTGTLALTVAYLLYEFIVMIGTWRAASKYEGRVIWAFLAKITVIFGWAFIAIIVLAIFRGFS